MQGVCSWTGRVCVLLLLLHCPDQLDSQHTTDHRKVPQRAENGDAQSSWGSWGPWSSCSRTCGNGVQGQTRACLPVYMQPSRGAGVQLQHAGRIISALSPGASPHRHGGRAFNSSSRGDLTRGKQTRPAERSRVTSILPGKYGYGRGPYAAPLQTDAGRRSEAPHLHKQRRSAAATSHHPIARGRSSFRSNSPNNLHGFSRPTHSNAQHLRHNQVWAPLYQPTSSNMGRVQPEVHPGSRQQHQERPYNPLPTSYCSGEHAHYRICHSNACPPSSGHIRVLQCSTFNKQPFMGRLYEWEPFNEVQEEQLCELHCRAVGFRFYVRHSEKVIDGTPCGQSDASLCVDGRCTNLGCDGYLGSGKVIDKCNVCGGDNSTCRLVSELFKHSFSKIGYHKIAEIPEGATKINVTEMVKSRNYLALRSRSGRSIINGNWAIDRPGRYEGGGTIFTYRRPNEISSTAGESLLAEGPTNEILDIYIIFQQQNPGVHYEYILPSQKITGPQKPNHRPEAGNGQDEQEKENVNSADQGRSPPRRPDNQVPAVQPPRRGREYNWKQTSATECSVSCGKGVRYPIFHCVNRLNHVQVLDSLCDSSSRPSSQEEACNLQPCPGL